MPSWIVLTLRQEKPLRLYLEPVDVNKIASEDLLEDLFWRSLGVSVYLTTLIDDEFEYSTHVLA